MVSQQTYGMKSKLTLPELKYFYHEKDMTIEQIANINGCGSSTIHRQIKKFNLKKNRKAIYSKINNSRKETFKKKYGKEHYMSSKIGYANYKSSLKESCGVDSIFKLSKTQNKIRKTHLTKYGVEFSIQNQAINQKRLDTLSRKYGDYKQMLAIKCAEKHIRNPSLITKITTSKGIFKVRSKLEAKIVKIISDLSGVSSIKYEPFIIKHQDNVIIPDLLINNYILIEIKYYKYSIIKKPNNITTREQHMWTSASNKIPKCRDWCLKNNYKFFVMTERNLKNFSDLNDLISHLEISDSNNTTLGFY